MPSLQEYKRRAIVPITGLGLLACYLFIFLPLAHRAEVLDAPLRQSWRALASTLGQTNATVLDFQRLTNQLRETRQALATLEIARKKAANRFELSSGLRAKMKSPFQLVEFEYERSRQLDELARLGRQQQVTIEPAVYAGFPEYTLDVRQPALLWPALSMVEGLLTAAIQSKVTVIHALDSPQVFTNNPASVTAGQIARIPLQIELTGPVTSVLRLLQSLPLRSDECLAAGLPEAPAGKLPLLFERLTIRKQSPEKPDEVRVSLRVAGFVFQE